MYSHQTVHRTHAEREMTEGDESELNKLLDNIIFLQEPNSGILVKALYMFLSFDFTKCARFMLLAKKNHLLPLV